METVKLFSAIYENGLTVALLSAISVILFVLIKKIFPKIPNDYSAVIKLLIAVAVCLIAYLICGFDENIILSKSLSVVGVSYAITDTLNLGDSKKEIADFISLIIPNAKKEEVDKVIKEDLSEEEIIAEITKMSEDGLSEKEISVIAQMIYKIKK